MKDTFINELLALKDKATKSQRKLIDYLKDAKTEEIIYLSITELSEITDVGEATILRFCRALGYKGYQEFKLSLAQGINTDENQTEDNFALNIADNMMQTLKLCKNKIKLDEINQAIDIILSSRSRSFFGSGNSYIPALELHYRLLKLGIISNIENSSHLQNIVASIFNSQDCLVLFSISGCTKDDIEIVEIAKQNGVKVITITSYDRSPLAKMSDVVIQCIKKESPIEGGSMLAKIGQLYIVDVICTGITLRKHEETIENIKKTSQSVAKKLV
jgi:DNA-binding MurR/RpiR family transcriptional regulator